MLQQYPFELLPLPYAYDALEPYIDTETMYLHHSRHLRAYMDHLNRLLKPYPQLHGWPLERLILENAALPGEIREDVLKNAGGVYNHLLYFGGISPCPTQLNGRLRDALLLSFHGLEEFYETFAEMAMGIFGSGYLWLTADENGRLVLLPLPNQMTPLTKGLYPVLNLDVWEHAYYLKHQNLRADYIRDWFRIVNWEEAERRYQSALLDNILRGGA